MLEFVLLHLGALDRQPALLSWITSWLPSILLHVLSPEDWFEKGHGICGGALNKDGIWTPTELPESWFLWAPLPSVADAVVDELDASCHKRKQHNHIFVAPCLMTFIWWKRLTKLCDLIFLIPPGARHFWPESEHEPLFFGLTLHFSLHSP
jgi:hypothetical protein